MSEHDPGRSTPTVRTPLVGVAFNRIVGGTCLVVGASIFCAVRLLHGDTPAADPAAALNFVDDRRTYAAVHVIAALAMLSTITGLMATASSLTHPAAWLIGRSAMASLLVGWAVFTVESSSEGLALPVLAAQATRADPQMRAELIQTARAVAEATYGPSLMGMALMIGTPLLLFGIAIVLDAGLPDWLGWAGAVIGVLTVATAVGLFLKPDLIPGFLLYGVLGSLLAQLWLAALGIHLLRRRHRGQTRWADT